MIKKLLALLTRYSNKRQMACCGFAISLLLLGLTFGYVLRRSDRELRSLRSGFASLAPFISYLLSGLVLPIGLLATVNEPFRWEIQTGYRNDHLHWHLQDAGDVGELLYDEKYDNLQFWENQLTIKVIHRDLALYVRGGYAAFGSGTLHQQFSNLSYATDQPQFVFPTNGWAADGTGYFGYAVNLTPDRTYRVILTPLVGYSGHYESLHRKGRGEWSSTDAVGAASYQFNSFFPANLHQTWYGVFIGGAFRVEPGGRLLFDFGYAYHWLQVRLSTQFAEEVSLFDPSSEFTQTNELKTVSGGNFGHSGWLQIDYWLNRAWRFGVAGQIRYYFTGVLSTTQQQTTGNTTVDLEDKLKLRWTSISAMFIISRSF
jgi:hypothetical protein